MTDIAKPIGEFLNDIFDLFVVVDGYPVKPAWAPKVEWSWSIRGMGSVSASSKKTSDRRR